MSNQILVNLISQRRLVFPKIIYLNFRLFLILISVFLLSLLSIYIFQINALTKASFSILNYEKKISELSRKNKNLKTYFSQTNSLAKLESLFQELNYEKVDRVHYLRILEEVVAAK